MKDIRICFVGDSFVNGTGDEQKLGWAGRLCSLSQNDKLEITYYNLGIRRNTSQDIKDRWQQECELRLQYDSKNLVVFSFGVNDTVIENNKLRISKTQSIENTKLILENSVKQYQVKMIGPPPIADDIQNVRIKELDIEFSLLCNELSIPYLSVFEQLLIEPIWLTEVTANDGSHPRANGYSYLAKIIQAWEIWQL
ncbi:MAG: GDSL-type esterase/lipase family protein [Candidatus Marithrix sp.]